MRQANATDGLAICRERTRVENRDERERLRFGSELRIGASCFVHDEQFVIAGRQPNAERRFSEHRERQRRFSGHRERQRRFGRWSQIDLLSANVIPVKESRFWRAGSSSPSNAPPAADGRRLADHLQQRGFSRLVAVGIALVPLGLGDHAAALSRR